MSSVKCIQEFKCSTKSIISTPGGVSPDTLGDSAANEEQTLESLCGDSSGRESLKYEVNKLGYDSCWVGK